MKKSFMWYYTLILTGWFAVFGLWEALTLGDEDSFYLFVFTTPIAIWLWMSREKSEAK